MFKLLVVLFIVKLYAQYDIFILTCLIYESQTNDFERIVTFWVIQTFYNFIYWNLLNCSITFKIRHSDKVFSIKSTIVH